MEIKSFSKYFPVYHFFFFLQPFTNKICIIIIIAALHTVQLLIFQMQRCRDLIKIKLYLIKKFVWNIKYMTTKICMKGIL